MASIRPYQNGYRAQLSISVPGGSAIRDSETFATQREAKAWALRREREIRERISTGASGKQSLKQAIDRYIEEVSPTKKGGHWEVLRLSALMRAKDLPIQLPIEQVTDFHLGLWRDKRMKEVSAGSVLREFHLLGSLFETARRDWKWIAINPVRDVRKPKSPKHRERLITSSEIRIMCRAMGYVSRQSPRSVGAAIALAFLLALRTGMRSGEITGLVWSRVKPLHVHLDETKTDNARDVPLDRRARQLIDLLRGFDNELVVGVSANVRDTMFRRARDKTALSGFTFHDARHNAATRIGRKVGKPGGLSFPMFCRMFGWRDPKYAMVYCNPSADDMADLL
jgi:integrase